MNIQAIIQSNSRS